MVLEIVNICTREKFKANLLKIDSLKLNHYFKSLQLLNVS